MPRLRASPRAGSCRSEHKCATAIALEPCGRDRKGPSEAGWGRGGGCAVGEEEVVVFEAGCRGCVRFQLVQMGGEMLSHPEPRATSWIHRNELGISPQPCPL